MEILKIEKLTKHFGALSVVHEFTTSIREGEKRAIIGPNGAGKTTLFNLITGAFLPNSGKIFFRQHSITGLKPYQIVRMKIARSFQKNNVFEGLTVFENVIISLLTIKHLSFDFMNNYMKEKSHRDQVFSLLDQVDLIDEASKKAGELSHGKKRHLEIAISLALEPELLLLDEPTSGMSPEETLHTMELIRRVSEGKTVVFIEHDMNVVFRIADRITVMHQGRVLADDSPEKIKADEEVKKAYLGTAE